MEAKLVLSSLIMHSSCRNLMSISLSWQSSSSGRPPLPARSPIKTSTAPSHRRLGAWTTPAQAAIDTNRASTQGVDVYHEVWSWILSSETRNRDPSLDDRQLRASCASLQARTPRREGLGSGWRGRACWLGAMGVAGGGVDDGGDG